MKSPPLHWQGRFRQAADEESVLALVAEFLASLPADSLARLPESSRPHGPMGRDEVIAHNVQVARDELLFNGPREVRELLRDMAIVFTEASARLATLSLGPPTGGF